MRLAKVRFVDGKSSFLDVLVSETRAYGARIDLVRAELAERLALVELYHATGGGWQPEPQTAAATALPGGPK